MPAVTWKFSISARTGSDPETSTTGLTLSSPEEVEEIAATAGLKTTGWEDKKVVFRSIEVCEPESSEKLDRLLEILTTKFGLHPVSAALATQREPRTFGVLKIREYSQRELDKYQLLWITTTTKRLADFGSLDEQGHLVVKKIPRTLNSFGLAVPFQVFLVSRRFKEDMEKQSFVGMEFHPVENSTELFRLGSSIVLPQCQTPLVDELGTSTTAHDWSHKWAEKAFYDDGYHPYELSYLKSQISSTPRFDIAMTLERPGGRLSKYPNLVVSQKLRSFLDQTGLATEYAPVRVI